MVLPNLLFPVNFTWLSFQWICQQFLIKPYGGGCKYNSISLHFCTLWQHVFFLFQAKMLELHKIFLIDRFFNRISCNKGLKGKISCFFLVFFLFNPLRLESPRIRKTTLFLMSHGRLADTKFVLILIRMHESSAGITTF